jgi:hypothetical protein
VQNALPLAREVLSAYGTQNAARAYDAGAPARWTANATFADDHQTRGADAVALACNMTPLIGDRRSGSPSSWPTPSPTPVAMRLHA